MTRSNQIRRDNVDAIATDLDRTLVGDCKHHLDSETHRFFERWLSEERHWWIVTGRPKIFVEHCVERWGIRPTGMVTRERFISYQSLEFWYWNERMTVLSRAIREQSPQWYDQLRTHVELPPSRARFEEDWAWFEQMEDARRARFLMEEITPGFVKPLRNRHYVGLVPRKAGKGNCIERLCKYFDIDTSSVLAIGNSHNDRSMLDGRLGFIPSAVVNADPEIKQLVLDNDGIVFEKSIGQELNSLVFDRKD